MTPTDDDFNYLLQAWTVPSTPPSLDGRLRRAYRDRTRSGVAWTRWISGLRPAAGMFAGVTAGAVVCMFVIAQAFPQSLAGLSAGAYRFTVDAEQIEYRIDGSSVISKYFTSGDDGMELWSDFPGDPIRTAQQRILDPLALLADRIVRPLQERMAQRHLERRLRIPGMAAALAEVRRTCVPGSPWAAVGKETILNYATTVTQKVWTEEGKPVRYTGWAAPDLHCFTLKSTTEKTFADGKLRPAFEMRVLKVTMAPAK